MFKRASLGYFWRMVAQAGEDWNGEGVGSCGAIARTADNLKLAKVGHAAGWDINRYSQNSRLQTLLKPCQRAHILQRGFLPNRNSQKLVFGKGGASRVPVGCVFQEKLYAPASTRIKRAGDYESWRNPNKY